MNKKTARFLKATTAAAMVGSIVVAVPQVQASGFSDVEATQYFYEDILTLQQRGVIDGYSDGTFRPNQAVTRGQAAKMLARALLLNTANVEDPGFSDVPKTHPYYGAIAALKMAGIIDGYPDGTFRSGAVIERNHMAKMLAEGLDLRVPAEVELPFTDVSEAYATNVAALYTYQITTGKTSTTFAGKSHVTRGQLAAFIMRAERAMLAIEEPGEEVQPVDGTWSFEVDEFTEAGITLGEYTYTYADDIAALFSEENAIALQGAEIEATFADGKMMSVESIRLVNAGSDEEPVVLRADVSVGALEIAASYVQVYDVQVLGNLAIAGTVNGKVLLNGVQVDGQLRVEEAPAVASAWVNVNVNEALSQEALQLHLENLGIFSGIGIGSGTMDMYMNRKEFALILARATSTIQDPPILSFDLTTGPSARELFIQGYMNQLALLADGPLAIIGAADIDEFNHRSPSDLQLDLQGVIRQLRLSVPGGRVDVPPTSDVSIDDLIIPQNANINDILPLISGAIPKINTFKRPDGSSIFLPGTSLPGPGSSTPPSSSGGDDQPYIVYRSLLEYALNNYGLKDSFMFDYTEESIDAYLKDMQSAIERAKTVQPRSVAEMEQEEKVFLAAQKKSQHLLEKKSLHNAREALKKANEAFQVLPEADYTADSYAQYKMELEKVRSAVLIAVLGTNELSIEKAHSDLNALNEKALGYLVDAATPGYKDMLRAALSAANLPAAEYTEESYAAYNTALQIARQTAQQVLDSERRAENVERAINDFNAAVSAAKEGLVRSSFGTYKNMLRERLDGVTAVNEADYTPASYASYVATKEMVFAIMQGIIDNETVPEKVEQAINDFDRVMNDAEAQLQFTITLTFSESISGELELKQDGNYLATAVATSDTATITNDSVAITLTMTGLRTGIFAGGVGTLRFKFDYSGRKFAAYSIDGVTWTLEEDFDS